MKRASLFDRAVLLLDHERCIEEAIDEAISAHARIDGYRNGAVRDARRSLKLAAIRYGIAMHRYVGGST